MAVLCVINNLLIENIWIEVIYIEILAETDYQDLYRISDGVLLVINKFKRIEYPSEPYFHVYTSDAKYKSYNKGCQKWLKVLKEDYKNKYNDIVVPKGTVLYMDYPVKPTSNKADWTYEIKTTASCLGGDFATTENMLNTILNIMKNKVSS